VPLVLATTFSTLFYPYYRWLKALFRAHRALSSLACCISLVLGLLIPTYILGHLVALQTIELYNSAQPKIKEIVRKGQSGLLGEAKKTAIVRKLKLDKIDIQSSLVEGLRTAGRLGTTVVNKTSAGLLSLIGNAAIMIFAMFYFFMDGEEIVRRLRYLSPIRDEYEEMILSRFLLISRATVKGTLLVGLTQGSIGAIALLIFGVKSWLLWGFVMVILSIIPLVGAWLVMIPAAVIQLILGNIWQGVGILLVSTVLISNIDNFIRPRLVGRDAKMHDLLIFFSTLGGLSVFGIMGFIVGPVIAALFVTILDIYSLEFKEQLNAPGTNSFRHWHV
jgi:predicted PurR-regulated permease PerM